MAKVNLTEFDDQGWAHVHYAAYRGFVKSIDKFVRTDPDQLEYRTADGLHSTPIHLAILGGHLEAVKCLKGLGARLDSINSVDDGLVEITVRVKNTDILRYLIGLASDSLPVWERLSMLMDSEDDGEVEATADMLTELMEGSQMELDDVISYRRHVCHGGVIQQLIDVIGSRSKDSVRRAALRTLLRAMTMQPTGKDEDDEEEDLASMSKMQAGEAGVIPLVVTLLEGSDSCVVRLSAKILSEMCVLDQFVAGSVVRTAIVALISALARNKDQVDTLVELVEALRVVVGENPDYQDVVGSTPTAVETLVDLFRIKSNVPFLIALTSAIVKIVRINFDNQVLFANHGLAKHLALILVDKNKELQAVAIEAVFRLTENNPRSRESVRSQADLVGPLQQILAKSHLPIVQQQMIARAMWSVSSLEFDELCDMAEHIGYRRLVEFIGSPADDLQFIGSEGIAALARAPPCRLNAISDLKDNVAFLMHPLVRLMKSPRLKTVLSAVRTLRHLAVGVGYVPRTLYQTGMAQASAFNLLIAMMMHAEDRLVQMESAYTVGCAAIGHPDNVDLIHQHIEFTYRQMIKTVSKSSMDADVRLLAGSALAAFAFNSVHNQKAIVRQGGVGFGSFLQLLRSNDECHRCNAAFQVVVLAPIFPDVDPAMSTAAGIKLLVDLLEQSTEDSIRALASDCIARLSHTRVGIPSGFVSMDAVDCLCDLLLSPAEQVRSNAAIALGYLSFNHPAKRQILTRCRKCPSFMHVIRRYSVNSKISSQLINDWKHYKHVNLPAVHNGYVNLVDRKDELVQH